MIACLVFCTYTRPCVATIPHRELMRAEWVKFGGTKAGHLTSDTNSLHPVPPS